MRAGDIIGGTAFAHVRRNGSPAIRATPTDAGWRLDGGAPWATSWGIAGRFSVAAETDDGRIVWVMLPGDGGPGVSARPIELPVFAATGTVVLHFDGCQVTADDVISVDNADTWRAADRRRAAIGQPAVLGVADRAVRLLAESDRGPRGDAARAAQHLREELERVWTADDELTTAMIDGHDAIAEASHHRARCLAFAQRCTTALLAAAGGAGMDLRHPAQRLAREATFYVIQAQTSDGRAATLEYQLGSDTR
jgi:alkylation response protein AidB-like acyl-CoA dehydrogenase